MLVESNNSIVSNVYLLELYVPYDKTLVEQYGDGYNMLGLVKARVYKDEDSFNRKKFKTFRFEHPTTFLTKPNDVSTIIAPFEEDDEEAKYYIFKYFKGGIVIFNNIILKNTESVEKLFISLTEGKLLYAGYKNLADILAKSKVMNDVDLSIPAYMEELILSLCYREKEDPNKYARHSKTGNLIGLTSRVGISSRVYPGISFQDPYYMLTSASITEEEGDTDLEQIIKGEYKIDDDE